MLAGERFTDRPRCVDPVIAAYMRALNDRLGAKDRQRLFPYASIAVGTRTDRAARARRRNLCLEACGYPPTLVARMRVRVRLAIGVGLVFSARLGEPAAELAARRFTAARDVEGAFALLDALLGTAGAVRLEASPLPRPVARLPELRVPAGVAQLVVEP